MSFKGIVVVGHDLSAWAFIRWYRAFDLRSPITMLAETDFVGVPRKYLPWIGMGLLECKDAPHISPHTLSTAYNTSILRCSFDEVHISNGKVMCLGREYEGLIVVSSGTEEDPRVSKLASISMASLPNALRARDIVENWDGEVYVYGGFEGINAVDAVREAGLKPVLCSYEDPFEEVLDQDMALIARKIMGELVVRPVKEPPNGQGIVFGLEKPRIPRGFSPRTFGSSFIVEEGIYGVGSCVKIRTELGEVWALCDETAYQEGFTLANEIHGLNLGVPPPLRVAQGLGVFIGSCGLTVKEAREAGVNHAATRLSIKKEGSMLGAIKLVVNRDNLRVVGCQVVVREELSWIFNNLYMLVSAGSSLPEARFLPRYLAGYDIGGLFGSLWRKVVVWRGTYINNLA